MLVERFTCYHRRSYVCKSGVGDVLTGAAAAISPTAQFLAAAFGPKTKAAVAEYQEAIGLPATGQIATFTWSALGEETVSAALDAVTTADGFVDGEPAEIQESPEPKSKARNTTAGDPPVLEEPDSG